MAGQKMRGWQQKKVSVRVCVCVCVGSGSLSLSFNQKTGRPHSVAAVVVVIVVASVVVWIDLRYGVHAFHQPKLSFVIT